MSQRDDIERLLQRLYTDRAGGDLDGVCRAFADDVRFEISGASPASRMAMSAQGLAEARKWLTLLVKSFQIGELAILGMIIEGERAAVQWRASIRSRITGVTVLTDLVDLVQVRKGRIAVYTEYFVPR